MLPNSREIRDPRSSLFWVRAGGSNEPAPLDRGWGVMASNKDTRPIRDPSLSRRRDLLAKLQRPPAQFFGSLRRRAPAFFV